MKNVRVLMFGWEFPPHISGGLGTACLGIAQGLAKNDVEVLFVMPKDWKQSKHPLMRARRKLSMRVMWRCYKIPRRLRIFGNISTLWR